MAEKIAVLIVTMSALCFAKPITQHTLVNIKCSSIVAISDEAELVSPCEITTVNEKFIDDKNKDVLVRFKKDKNGIIQGRVERSDSNGCDTRAVMVHGYKKLDEINTFIAMGESSEECFGKMIRSGVKQ